MLPTEAHEFHVADERGCQPAEGHDMLVQRARGSSLAIAVPSTGTPCYPVVAATAPRRPHSIRAGRPARGQGDHCGGNDKNHWLVSLVGGGSRSLRELAERDGITRRYVRRLVDLAFLSPELVEAILQGRQPVELTATRLTELDLPLDWADQRSLLAR